MGGFATSTAFSAMQYAMDNAQSKEKAKVNAASAAAAAQSQADQIKTSQQIEERTRQDNLERQLASSRARFGAQGTSGGGSSTAALATLAGDAAQESADSVELANQRIQRINDEYRWGQSKSLLDSTYPAYRSGLSLVRQGVSGGLSLLDE